MYCFILFFSEISPNPSMTMDLSDHKRLCQFVRNAKIFVEVNKMVEFAKWIKHGYSKVKPHQYTEFDDKISFLHQQFQTVEMLHCNYGVSEIYLTEIKKPEKYYILRLRDGNSEMQSTVAYVIKSLRILDYKNKKTSCSQTSFLLTR